MNKKICILAGIAMLAYSAQGLAAVKSTKSTKTTKTVKTEAKTKAAQEALKVAEAKTKAAQDALKAAQESFGKESEKILITGINESDNSARFLISNNSMSSGIFPSIRAFRVFLISLTPQRDSLSWLTCL